MTKSRRFLILCTAAGMAVGLLSPAMTGGVKIAQAQILATSALAPSNPHGSPASKNHFGEQGIPTTTLPDEEVRSDSLGVAGNPTLNPTPPSSATANHPMVPPYQGTLVVRVADPTGKRVVKAKVILIGTNGRIAQSGDTNGTGQWETHISYRADPRLSMTQPLGTTTALVFAKGYNEAVVFEVPLAPYAVQPVTLTPFILGRRNEPLAALGNIHRHTVADMLDYYAAQVGIARQSAKDLPMRVPANATTLRQ